MKLITEDITFKVLENNNIDDSSNLGLILAKLIKEDKKISNTARVDILGRFSSSDSSLCKTFTILALANNNPIGLAFASYYGISKIIDYQFLRCLPKYREYGIEKELDRLMMKETSEFENTAIIHGKIYRELYRNSIDNLYGYDDSKYTKMFVRISHDENLSIEFNREKKYVDSIFKKDIGFATNFFTEKNLVSSIDEYSILSFLSDIVTFDCISNPNEKAEMCKLFTSVRKSIGI